MDKPVGDDITDVPTQGGVFGAFARTIARLPVVFHAAYRSTSRAVIGSFPRSFLKAFMVFFYT